MVTFENLVTTGFFTALFFGAVRAVLVVAGRKRAPPSRGASLEERALAQRKGTSMIGLPNQCTSGF